MVAVTPFIPLPQVHTGPNLDYNRLRALPFPARNRALGITRFAWIDEKISISAATQFVSKERRHDYRQKGKPPIAGLT